MDEGNSFTALIQKWRAGDQSAAIELVRRYEPAIRRVVRLQLRDPRLRRILDSMDVCQSVLASFFLRAATGQYDLNQPAQLLRLLAVMARNKVASQARRSYDAAEGPFFAEEDACAILLLQDQGRITRLLGRISSMRFVTGCRTTNGGCGSSGRGPRVDRDRKRVGRQSGSSPQTTGSRS